MQEFSNCKTSVPGQVVLGRGNFGTVMEGVASGLYGTTRSIPLAAKVLNSRAGGLDEATKKQFEREVELMIKAGKHLNLVNLLGVVLDGT